MNDKIKGPYILWKDYRCEGWQPESFNSIKEALEAERYGNSFVITRKCEYRIIETPEKQLRFQDFDLLMKESNPIPHPIDKERGK